MTRGGLLEGVRVVELASELGAFAGKLLAGMGADVVLVEPPGGHPARRYGPLAEGADDGEGSRLWWHYHTAKRGIVLDLADDRDADVFRRLARSVDVVVEAEPPGRLDALGLGRASIRAEAPRLVWTSITPWGPDNPRSHDQATDLTIQAEGGPVWSCGYDDHTLPPVRPGGNQGLHTAALFAVMGTLTALVHRDASGAGQCVDVSAVAASHVTTEAATYEWLVAGRTVERQTGRHASVYPTAPTAATSADGRLLNTGVPPRSRQEFEGLVAWLHELGIADDYPELGLLLAGIERDGVHMRELGSDAEALAVFGAGREAMQFIAGRMPAREFFVEAQRRGFTCGVVVWPHEVLDDPHFAARGFPVAVRHEELAREVTYAGAPFISSVADWRVGRAPRLDEHRDEVLRQLGDTSPPPFTRPASTPSAPRAGDA